MQELKISAHDRAASNRNKFAKQQSPTIDKASRSLTTCVFAIEQLVCLEHGLCFAIGQVRLSPPSAMVGLGRTPKGSR